MMTSGYQHANYAHAFVEFGQPLYLPASGGWVLRRAIQATSQADATSCYPLFACRDWAGLADDFAALEKERGLVSLTAVTDPLGAYNVNELQFAFGDLVRPFKEHFVADLSQPLKRFVCSHHRRNALHALQQLTVERCAPDAVLDEWLALYGHLIQRHHIEGIATFSRASFARQLHVPGIVVFRAQHQGETVGMTLWYRREDRAYYHLAAYSPRGYQLKASFALFWRAFEHFAGLGVHWLALGANAGLNECADNGLTRFKRGWATGKRTTYLCGRIFDKAAYAALAQESAVTDEFYFPAYRRPVGLLAQAASKGSNQ